MIKADYDDELMQFGKEKSETKVEIDDAVKAVARRIGLEEKTVKLEYTNQHGYTYRVTMKVTKSNCTNQKNISALAL